MPLIRIDTVANDVKLGLWRMDEPLGDLPRPEGVDFSDIHSEVRLRERLTTYCLLGAMTGQDNLIIRHEPSGKPVVEGYEISVSHTKGWAAAMMSHDNAVGVDIEYYSERVNKVADRFIRPDEQNDTLAHRLINWSAKEAVYKLLSAEDLQYFEMRLARISCDDEGVVEVEDLKEGGSVAVSYTLNDDYVLTWAWKPRAFMLSSTN